MIDLDALETVAKAATPGPWHAGWDDDHWDIGPRSRDCCMYYGTKEDAAHIAAANPQTILALIAELRAARDVVKYARTAFYTPDNTRWYPGEDLPRLREAFAAYDAALARGRG